MLLLDIALDNYFRLCIERMDKSRMAGDDFVSLTGLVLRNAVIAYDSIDLQQAWDSHSQSLCSPLSVNIKARRRLCHALVYLYPVSASI